VEKQSLEVLDCMDNLAAQLSIPTTSLISHLGLASLFLTPDFSTEVHRGMLQHLFSKSQVSFPQTTGCTQAVLDVVINI